MILPMSVHFRYYTCILEYVIHVLLSINPDVLLKHESTYFDIDFKMVKHYIHLVKHIDLNMQKNELTDFDKYMLKHKLTYFDIDPF